MKHINLKEIKVKSDMLLDVRDRPYFKDWIILSLQHVLAMFGATVLTPMLINMNAHENIIGIDVTLFSSGIGTLIYILLTGARVPIYLGSSFAYIGTMASLYPIYGTSMFFGLIGVGIVYAIVALLIYFFGTGWLKKLLPPVVVGPMIIVIGLGLAGSAVTNMGLNSMNNVDWYGVAIALITMGIAMFSALWFRGRLKLMPILLAMIVGFVCSLIVSSWHKGFVKYDDVDWGAVSTYIGVPDFSHSMLAGYSGVDSAGNSFKWSVIPLFVMMPIAFATIAEHIGDHTVLGKITGRDYINGKPGLHRTLLGDGLATAVAGVLGAPANTSYGENTTTVGISKVGSVYVTGLAAVFAILMSFIKIVPTILNLMPPCVIGGLGLVLYGFIASNGFKTLVDEQVKMNDIRNIFVMSSMLVIGLGGAVVGFMIGNSAVVFSGTSLSMFFGVIVNLVLPKDRGLDMSKMPKVRPVVNNQHIKVNKDWRWKKKNKDNFDKPPKNK